MFPDEEPTPEDELQDLSLAWQIAKERLQRVKIGIAHCVEMIQLLEEQALMERQEDNGQAYRHPGRV